MTTNKTLIKMQLSLSLPISY